MSDRDEWRGDEMDTLDLGQIAYEAYGNAREWKTVGGLTMPTWEEQDDGIKVAWSVAAEAVVAAVDEDADVVDSEVDLL